jgi:hypothetical protein
VRHAYSRRTRHLEEPALCRSHLGHALAAMRRGLAASTTATLVVAMVCLFFPASGGASEKPAALSRL